MSDRSHPAPLKSQSTRGKKPRRNDELTLNIDALAQGGAGVGRADGFVLFVPLTAPGDRARVRVARTHKRHAEGELLQVEQPSESRVEPECPYFGKCGGCAWQHLSYEAQLSAKEDLVRESFERLSDLSTDLPLSKIIPSPEKLRYRNKMELSFHPKAGLGFHRRGFFDQVVQVDECLLASAAISRILREVASFVDKHELPLWNSRDHVGLMRHLVLRESKGTGELMVGLVTTSDPFPQAAELAETLVTLEPRVAAVVRAITDARADAVGVESLEVLHGRDHIFEILGGIRFRVGLETFFQTNTLQAERMGSIVEEMSDLKGNENVVDLFCGVGTFALLLARKAARVLGLEISHSAIESARMTAQREGIDNVELMTGDARRGLPQLLAQLGCPPDLLILDPPRSGAGGKVMRRIGRSGAKRVIYVSCNPSTLAPDLAWLVPFGYRIDAVQPIDLFPQTHHVETIVRLDRLPEADEILDPFKGS